MRPVHHQALATLIVCAFAVLTVGSVAAEQIWTGHDFCFEKDDGTDWILPQNQDRITSDVWITRAATKGIFNAAWEVAYQDRISPLHTEWAFGNAADWASLTFTDWKTWHGSCPPCVLGVDAVVHLITDDIYIDIRFDEWSIAAGGGFAYCRSFVAPTSTEEGTWGMIKAVYR